MKKLIYVIILGMTAAACSPNLSDNVGFVTRLGNDTLAVETFTETPYGFETIVVLRSPQTSVTRYNIAFAEDGGIGEMVALTLQEGGITDGQYLKTFAATKVDDSLKVTTLGGDGNERSFTVEYEEGVLPFIDMVHWPFELALRKAAKSDADTVVQNMLNGWSIADFIVADLGDNHRTIRHPFRGVMDVKVDDKGPLLELDAAQTTRKLVVTRTEDIPIEKIADRFIALDAAGKSFGGLSGAVVEEFSINGANFVLDYGSPVRRGRDLFGGIVPYGERWRTGANRATHFKTSTDLRFGDLEVPAGEYTLFTIPEANGGTLIINKQTGQNGRNYDESRDLGRVPMQVRSQTENTENFTITVSDEDGSPTLNLMWGNTVYFIPFDID